MLSLSSSGTALNQLAGSSNAAFSGSGSTNDNVPILTIREKQKDALKEILNLNSPVSNSEIQEPVWKVFIYDRCGQDIVSPLLSVKELRDHGVTVHLPLHSDRDSIPYVPAVYFVMPTDENIQRICQDFRNNLYGSYYLNFISPISRSKLEELATVALQANCQTKISKIFDQYLNFVSLEEDVFILKHTDHDAISYFSLNRPGAEEAEIERIVDYIVDSLFAVFVTLGVVPVIRAPRGNASEMIAQKLDKKLRQNLRDTRSSFFTGSGVGSGHAGDYQRMLFSRPVLIILDRTIDMATPLSHSWTYQALAHDVLDMKLNQVFIAEDEAKEASGEDEFETERKRKNKSKAYDLSSQDKFWTAQRGSPFPQVAEAIQERLDQYRSSEDEVKRLKSEMGLDVNIPDQAISLISDNTTKLTNAINTLPELLEAKRLIDLHTTIASAILEFIKQRKLDVYFEVEERICATKGAIDPKQSQSPLDLIRDPQAGTWEDKLRLFLIYFWVSNMSDNETEQFLSELKRLGCDLGAFEYLRSLKNILGPFVEEASPFGGSGVDSIFQTLGGGTKTVNMFSKLMSQGSQFVMEGVKNLVVKKHSLPITRIVDSLMEGKSVPETEKYLSFDPKVLNKGQNSYGGEDSSWSSMSGSTNATYQDAIVFVVGGGNYMEYHNLLDYCKTKSKPLSPKRIIYGSTDMVNPKRFLSQLTKLGSSFKS